MNDFKYLILGVLFSLILLGCKSDKERIEGKIVQMKSHPVDLCLEKMDSRRNPLMEGHNKYTLVVYVDSAECSPCALSKLRFWNPVIESAKKRRLDVAFVFILAPKSTEMEDVNLELDVTDLQSSIYVDTSFIFRKKNDFIPSEQEYHTFLLGQDGEILVIGNPLENGKLKAIYKKVVGI